jgi:hypothetical protein
MSDHLSAAGRLADLFGNQPLQGRWFGVSFLRLASLAAVDRAIAQLKRAHGTVLGISQVPGGHELRFSRAVVPVSIELDAHGHIVTLLFRPPRRASHAPTEVLERLHGLPGRIGVLAMAGNKEVVSHAADEPFAVASAFKLAIVLALRRAVESGAFGWNTVVSLTPTALSLPPGTLQDWPTGAPLTLYSLAALMISQSDNTAADLLMEVLSRERIEAVAPRLRPLLNTRELCLLKLDRNTALRERFAAGSESERRLVLAELAGMPAPNSAEIPAAPNWHEVEWQLTPRELCGMIADAHDLDFMGIDVGPLSTEGWETVVFKSGTEPGVLSLNAWLEHAGKSYCVSLTVNSRAAVDVLLVQQLFQMLISSLSGGAPSTQ